MSGDYTRFTFDPRKRFSGVLQQQGRVQLDAEWNEAVAIFKRRIRVQALDTFGPVGVAQLTTPDAFDVSVAAGPPLDLALKPGRIYVDGILAELFPDETASYLKQPFLPDPPPLPAGDAVVYLDLWEREVTYIEDPALLEPALGGVDTATRTQAIWQLKVDARPGAVCGMEVGAPPSAGRLTTEAIAPPAPDDPCILPPLAGYRGLENRLYRIEIHTGGPLGAARFKWSRDNGSIVSAVGDIAVAGGQTTLSVNRLGRDQVLRFVVGNWVTVTDDFRELAGEPGEMARILAIDEANAKLVLDRGLPSGTGRPFGANPTELAARHTRVQRWDESAPANTVDADGLIVTAAGPDRHRGGHPRRLLDRPGGRRLQRRRLLGVLGAHRHRLDRGAERRTAARHPPPLRAARRGDRARRPVADDLGLPAAPAGRRGMLLHLCRGAGAGHPKGNRLLARRRRLRLPEDRPAPGPGDADDRPQRCEAGRRKPRRHRAGARRPAGADHRHARRGAGYCGVRHRL